MGAGDAWSLVGLAAAFFTSTSFIPQLIQRWKNPAHARISYGTLGTFLCGTTLWAAYGIHLGDWIIIGANSFVFLNVSALMLLQWVQERPAKLKNKI